MSVEITERSIPKGTRESARDLDLLAELAKQKLNCDMVFISLSHQDRLFSVGLDLETAEVESNRVHYALNTICSATTRNNQIVLLKDASLDQRFQDLAYVTKGPIVAYLGAPLRDKSSSAFGAVCAICKYAREWLPNDAQFLEQLSIVVGSLITKELQRTELSRLHESLREADLIAMSLARGVSAMISVHKLDGSVLFSSMSLMNVASEEKIAKVGQAVIGEFRSKLETSIDDREFPSMPSNTSRVNLKLRSSRTSEFDIELSNPAKDIYFLEWSQLRMPRLH